MSRTTTSQNWFGRASTGALGLIAGAALMFAAGSASAENVSADQIIRALSHKPITRSLSGPRPAEPAESAAEGRFIDSLRNRPTRSLSSGERAQIASIVDEKPKIDLEINFDYNSAEISRNSMAAVNELGKALSSQGLKGMTFLVAGHTDAAGSDDYNQALSERRADTIKRTLVEKFGIEGSQLVAAGYGESRLKNPGAPLDAVNRRVQVVTLTSQTAAAQ